MQNIHGLFVLLVSELVHLFSDEGDFLQVADVLSIPLVRVKESPILFVKLFPQVYQSKVSELFKAIVHTR